ncbi:MAG: hypothetical protein ACRDA3_15705 [Peptostreptococcaceae bacterium]
MYKKIKRLIVVVAILFTTIFTTNIRGEEYSINDLIENGKDFDKNNISITGEAIGEALDRGEYTWININDTTNAIGIYMSTSDAKNVANYGGFNKIGDTIEVKGIFNRACKEHGGDMDIHAKSVDIIKQGNKVDTKIDLNKIMLLVLSTVILLILAIIYRKNINNKSV